MTKRKQKKASDELTIVAYDVKSFDGKTGKQGAENFKIWHSNYGRGAYVQEDGSRGYCPLVEPEDEDWIGLYAQVMQKPLVRLFLDNYPMDDYGVFIVNEVLPIKLFHIYLLELHPGLPATVNIGTWHPNNRNYIHKDD
ncbi:hypothetical protein ACE1CD_24420 [Aerosakkonema sp. BLCC-F183]|uniref:hypothetical protein n=1 Tax=Aerosakkonema sp. BLCC-F183 TaxID=3342834 RepID=UPI0035BA87F6